MLYYFVHDIMQDLGAIEYIIALIQRLRIHVLWAVSTSTRTSLDKTTHTINLAYHLILFW